MSSLNGQPLLGARLVKRAGKKNAIRGCWKNVTTFRPEAPILLTATDEAGERKEAAAAFRPQQLLFVSAHVSVHILRDGGEQIYRETEGVSRQYIRALVQGVKD